MYANITPTQRPPLKEKPSSLKPQLLPHITKPIFLPNRSSFLPTRPTNEQLIITLDLAPTIAPHNPPLCRNALGGEGVGADGVSGGLCVLDKGSQVEVSHIIAFRVVVPVVLFVHQSVN